jgi:L-alanine-DL-glutamate epimerase-like enolase superfamily enzyme
VYYAWEDHLLTEPHPVTDGAIPVPEGPGLGIEVDREAVERLRTDR